MEAEHYGQSQEQIKYTAESFLDIAGKHGLSINWLYRKTGCKSRPAAGFRSLKSFRDAVD